jgi:hypothetical protein
VQKKTSVKVTAEAAAAAKRAKKELQKALVKDPRLAALNEALSELRQVQQRIAVLENNTPPGSVLNSSAGSATANEQLSGSNALSANNGMPAEVRDAVEKLSHCLFEFLRTGFKPMDASTSSPTATTTGTATTANVAMLKSIMNESPMLRAKSPQPTAAPIDSTNNSLTQTFSQYLQLWNLVEFTINLNIVQSEKMSKQQAGLFNLSKEVYLTLFQEINKYEHVINQTYLIDTSSINTSQLRRKHYFMVVLMSLKVKFQLFVVNLLK